MQRCLQRVKQPKPTMYNLRSRSSRKDDQQLSDEVKQIIKEKELIIEEKSMIIEEQEKTISQLQESIMILQRKYEEATKKTSET